MWGENSCFLNSSRYSAFYFTLFLFYSVSFSFFSEPKWVRETECEWEGKKKSLWFYDDILKASMELKSFTYRRHIEHSFNASSILITLIIMLIANSAKRISNCIFLSLVRKYLSLFLYFILLLDIYWSATKRVYDTNS